MGKRLSNDEQARYHTEGYLCPVDALPPPKARELLESLESFEASAGAPLGKQPGQLRAKTHLLFPWMNTLVRHDAILDAVEDLIGPNILVYHVTCWLKEPGDASYVSWHQDGTYFLLDPPEHVTAWIALTDSTEQSGCVAVIPSSHTVGQRRHEMSPCEDNLLSNGQHVDEHIDPSDAVPLVLQAGQMSLHHTHLIHSSGPNVSHRRRIGIGISYIPTHVQYSGRERVSASLVRGADEYQHFDPEPAPASEMHAAAKVFHAQACGRFFGNHGSRREVAADDGIEMGLK